MIDLNNLTLVAIDTDPNVIPLTRSAALHTLSIIKPKEFIFFGGRELLVGEKYYPINRFRSINDYSKFVLKCLWPFVSTDYIMIIHWDGFPVNEYCWNNDFLSYDYIGAPWIWSLNGYNVGNGGFSIRSRKLIEICSEDKIQQDHSFEGGAEDVMIGVKYRGYFEERGCVFPSSSVAAQFSYELGVRSENSFGFHGPMNIPLFASEKYLLENVEALARKMKGSAICSDIVKNSILMGHHQFLNLFLKLI